MTRTLVLVALLPVEATAVRAKPATAHPFFWAPFVLVGDGGATP